LVFAGQHPAAHPEPYIGIQPNITNKSAEQTCFIL
jgi:hypothetical protein